jgi:hypothetical protein
MLLLPQKWVYTIFQKKKHGINHHICKNYTSKKYVIAEYCHNYLFASSIFIVNALTIPVKTFKVKHLVGGVS